MADSFVQLAADSVGKKIDTRTEGSNSEHRQVMVIGDPATNAGVAPVDATKGLAVDLTATGQNTTALKVDGSATTQPVSGSVTADTELPAAAALSDATANPTTPSVGAFPMVWNGTTWDRLFGTASSGAYVQLRGLATSTQATADATSGQLGAANLLYNGTNWDRARTQPTGSPSLPGTTGITAVGANVQIGASSFAMIQSPGQLSDASSINGGVTVGAWVYNGATWDRIRSAGGQIGSILSAPAAATTGGSTPYHLISAATTNANNIKGSAGTVSTIVAMNTNAAARFLKLYDKATSPTVGTDVPVHTFVLPGNSTGAGVAVPLAVPLGFSNGISVAITAAITDADATAISANDCAINIGYK